MKIVIALGGNALGNSPKEQLELVKKSSVPIVNLIEDGHKVVIAHGNGPQVGMINLAFEESRTVNDDIPEVPFAECNAMSQGYIGFHLQNALREELLKRDIGIGVSTLVTQVVVDKEDSAFKNPTKPIGSFFTKEDSEKISKETGEVFLEDAGRGYRRVVASPKPIDVVEIESISTLVENNNIVITVGGGGIPVYRDGNSLIGVDAVIDKDFASAKLAEQLEADYLIILTAVDKVAINFGKADEKWLDSLDIETLDKYIEEGHFAPGSMLPKIEAAREFAVSKAGRKTLITSLENANKGIRGETGTLIENN